ncbi:hypothetical protein M5K25_008822 [Dendrobium thyrsiflorum]|uniref:Uncharacterized protein n=1 Tax=Dendrobium thyrsiflorum TaxID=117978 RepID=A0ABD0VAJ9_DENTH
MVCNNITLIITITCLTYFYNFPIPETSSTCRLPTAGLRLENPKPLTVGELIPPSYSLAAGRRHPNTPFYKPTQVSASESTSPKPPGIPPSNYPQSFPPFLPLKTVPELYLGENSRREIAA